MNLFELYATLTLDISQFDKEQKDAAEKAEKLQTALEELGNPTVSLGTDANGNVFAAIIDDAEQTSEKVDTTKQLIKNTDSAMGGLKRRALATEAVISGVTAAIGQIVEDLINGLIDFGKDAMAQAAQTGSEIAKAYNAAQESILLSTSVLKEKVGTGLLKIATPLLEAYESLLGISKQEKAAYVLQQIDSYAFENIKKAKENFSAIFGLFEKIEMPEPITLGELEQGQLSQLNYWKEYNDTVAKLQDRLSGHEDGQRLLAELSNGSEAGFSQMQALAAATDQQIAAFLQTYAQVEAERDAAATSSAETSLLFDENVKKMVDTMDSLIEGMDQAGQAEANTSATGQAAVNGLAAHYGSFSAMVDQYNRKLSELGQVSPHLNNPNNPYGNNYHGNVQGGGSGQNFAQKAVGLDYVPYNGYLASLHRGEAILTARQAEDYRAVQMGYGSQNPVNITINMQSSAKTGPEMAAELKYELGKLRFAT